jgi:hypothetical protein
MNGSAAMAQSIDLATPAGRDTASGLLATTKPSSPSRISLAARRNSSSPPACVSRPLTLRISRLVRSESAPEELASADQLEPGAAYRAFRGRDPKIEPMLKKKGLLVAAPA